MHAMTADLFDTQEKRQPLDTVVRLFREHVLSLEHVRERMYLSRCAFKNNEGAKFLLAVFSARTGTLQYYALLSKGDHESVIHRFDTLPLDTRLHQGEVHNAILTLQQHVNFSEKRVQCGFETFSSIRLRSGHGSGTLAVDLAPFLSQFEIVDRWTYHG